MSGRAMTGQAIRGRAIIVAGPTCAGKSALAMALAQRLGGVVINADAMQTYAALRVLTARPTAADEALVAHALYGVRAADHPATVAWWCAAARDVMATCGRVPVFCGGSGMYLSALVHGLAAVPDPGAAARGEARGMLAEVGAAGLHARLAACDPVTAARLRPSDGQRVARAWEVWRGTGRGLAAWQADPVQQSDIQARVVMLAPQREILLAAVERRWQGMLADGAVEEVAALRAGNLDPALPVMRAHGVRELGAYLEGAIGLHQAGERAIAAMRHYVKRQATWWRHRAMADERQTFTIHARWTAGSQESIADYDDLASFLSQTS